MCGGARIAEGRGGQMGHDEVYARIVEIGIVPVIRTTSAKLARTAADAIRAGGIPVLEITMTVPGAVEAIRELARDAGNDLLVGAGTVVDADSAKRCIDAGAQFLVGPGFDAGMVEAARKSGVVVVPGALTPTEILAAVAAGADFVKIFPCAQLGGPNYIKALRGPFPKVPLVPTGGVNLNSAADYLRAGATALGVGGELVDKRALESGKTSAITENARRFREIVEQIRANQVVSAK